MEPIDRELIYKGILKMILWGDSKEEVIRKLKVNGISGGEAEDLYRRAFQERLQAIRAPYWRKVVIGGVIVGVAFGSFGFMWFYLGGITYQLLILCAAGLGIGLWIFGSGVGGVLSAVTKEGPVSDS